MLLKPCGSSLPIQRVNLNWENAGARTTGQAICIFTNPDSRKHDWNWWTPTDKGLSGLGLVLCLFTSDVLATCFRSFLYSVSSDY